MQRAAKTAVLVIAIASLLVISVTFSAAGNRNTTAEKRVIMCGRSVMSNWFTYWGWDGDDSHIVSRNGYTLQHGQSLEGAENPDAMVQSFVNNCDAVPEGTSPVMFFKFCFVDFSGDNLTELQGIVNRVIQVAHDHGLRLIIGNALPQITATPELVNEHRAYNAWLVERAKQISNIWIYDMYGVLSNSSGALKPEYQTVDSHPNDAGYNALDATYFPFLDSLFGSAPSPPPPQVNRSWYFAEGTTAYGFEEFICIQNPTVNEAIVQATYMLPEGKGEQAGVPFRLAAGTRTTINVGDIIKDSDVSIRVDSDQDIICERSMYWNNRIEGTDSIGVMEPSTTWLLSEGCTAFGFEEYLCIQNPAASAATVNITYNTTTGPVSRQPLRVPAKSRQTIRVNDEVEPTNVSTVVNSDEQIIAERAMYWDGRRGGHASIGTTSPANSWFLAEGSTNWGFDTFVLIQNPSTKPTTVSVNFLTTDGPIPMKPFAVGAGSRYTINVREEIGGEDFSTSVTGTEAITCERSMYWNNGTGKAGHDTIGVTKATYNNYLAEGSTNYGFDTYVLVSNPNDEVNDVQVTYMTQNGIEPRAPITMQPNTRFTVHVNEDLAASNVAPTDVSIRVVGNFPVVAERAMYWNNRGGGHDSIGFMCDY
jgi:hypothetical protein